jgi:hypothetical protein
LLTLDTDGIPAAMMRFVAWWGVVQKVALSIGARMPGMFEVNWRGSMPLSVCD